MCSKVHYPKEIKWQAVKMKINEVPTKEIMSQLITMKEFN
jgi:hypothetical protein